jgi:hypothetical protein
MSAAKSKKSAHKTLGIEVKGDVPIKVRKWKLRSTKFLF